MKFKRIDEFGNEIPYQRKDNGFYFSDFAEVFFPESVNKIILAPKTKKIASTIYGASKKVAGCIIENGIPIAVKATTKAVANTCTVVKDGANITSDILIDRSPKKALGTLTDIVIRKLKSNALLITKIGEATYLGAKAGYKSIRNKDISAEDKQKLKQCGIIVATSVAAILISGEMYHSIGLNSPAEDIPLLVPDIESAPFIENGVFGGNDNDLSMLISMGEIDNTQHIETVRDPSAVAEFYKIHSLTPTEGYEVHHIIPLSEGGADTYDNMVLIRSDLHSKITEAHRRFYGWHDSK